MKIKGTTDGTAPIGGTGAIDGAEPVGEVAPAEAPSVGATGAAARPGGRDAVSQVAARLRAGEISVDQAVEALIDDAIERQVGRATEGSKDLEPRLRELLRNYAANDPFLAARIRKLTLAK